MTERGSGGVGEWGTGAARSPGNAGSGPLQGSDAPDPAVARDSAPSPTPPLSPSAGPSIALEAVLAWLDARESPPPPELRERMEQALAAVRAETVPGALAEAALACLEVTVAQPEERASALHLLAADALLTYALEAAAELGAETLRRMTAEYGPATLGRALPEEGEA